MQLPMLPADKANHAIYGTVVFLVAALLVARAGQPGVAHHIGLLAVATAGVAKELLDRWLNRRAVARGQAPVHGVELLDIVATAAPAVALWLAVPVLRG